MEDTYTAKSAHLDALNVPRRAIDPLELAWAPARDSIVMVAGIVSGCRLECWKWSLAERWLAMKTEDLNAEESRRCSSSRVLWIGRRYRWR